MARILILDDSASTRTFVRHTLEGAGYDVDEATDGAEGIRRLGAVPVDLVITDMFMPNRDGLETIREVRRRYPQTKILAMSGGGSLATNDVLWIAQRLGAHGTLVKPFGPPELLEAVRKVLSG